jgi:hypothetical protein
MVGGNNGKRSVKVVGGDGGGHGWCDLWFYLLAGR